jgi:hypothetical protein
MHTKIVLLFEMCIKRCKTHIKRNFLMCHPHKKISSLQRPDSNENTHAKNQTNQRCPLKNTKNCGKNKKNKTNKVFLHYFQIHFLFLFFLFFLVCAIFLFFLVWFGFLYICWKSMPYYICCCVFWFWRQNYLFKDSCNKQTTVVMVFCVP